MTEALDFAVVVASLILASVTLALTQALSRQKGQADPRGSVVHFLRVYLNVCRPELRLGISMAFIHHGTIWLPNPRPVLTYKTCS